MNKLLEIKDKAVKFCGEYEHFILPVVRFAVAFIAFITIDLNIGYMAKISSMLVALLLALVCALLPVNAILWIASIMILLDMYALSIEVFAITFVLFFSTVFCLFSFCTEGWHACDTHTYMLSASHTICYAGCSRSFKKSLFGCCNNMWHTVVLFP